MQFTVDKTPLFHAQRRGAGPPRLSRPASEAAGLHLRGARRRRPMGPKAQRCHASTKEPNRTIRASTTDMNRESTTDMNRASTTDTIRESTTDTIRASTTDTIRASTTDTIRESTTDAIREIRRRFTCVRPTRFAVAVRIARASGRIAARSSVAAPWIGGRAIFSPSFIRRRGVALACIRGPRFRARNRPGTRPTVPHRALH